MKTFLAVVAIILSTVAVAGAEVDNPEYQRWSGFKAGAWVKFKMVSEASGTKTELEQAVKLVELTPAKAVVEIGMVTGGSKLPAQKDEVLTKQREQLGKRLEELKQKQQQARQKLVDELKERGEREVRARADALKKRQEEELKKRQELLQRRQKQEKARHEELLKKKDQQQAAAKQAAGGKHR